MLPETGGHEKRKANYGIDDPYSVFLLVTIAALLLLSSVGVYLTSAAGGESLLVSATAGVAGLAPIVVATILVWNSAVAKPREVRRLLRTLPLGGNEKILDVGCGRGLMLVGLAKRLKEGVAVGIDIWESRQLSGNSPKNAKLNAEIEGVKNVTLATSDAMFMPFRDKTFDVVLSSFAYRHLGSLSNRMAAMDEVLRVLKPGGTVVFVTTGNPEENVTLLKSVDMVDVAVSQLRSFVLFPTRLVIARKKTEFKRLEI